MTAVLALVRKDLKIFFSRPLIYLLAGFCTLLLALFFTFSVFQFVQRSLALSAKLADSGLNVYNDVVRSYVTVAHYLFLFVVAAVSMKFFAEEKSKKTFPMLLASPLRSWDIVLAKFAAGSLVITALASVAFLYPLSLAFYVKVPLAPMVTSFLGLVVLLMVYLAVGLFASAITESLIVAVVLSLTLNFFLLLMSTGKFIFDSPIGEKVFSYLSLDFHFGFFRQGTLSVASLVFFASLIVFFLYLCERVVEFHRWR